MRIPELLLFAALATSVPVKAAPHLTMDAGLVQEAGVQFIIDPTAISLRLRAESARPLTGLEIQINGRDVTELVLRNARIEVTPDGRAGSLLLERLPVFEIGYSPASSYRVEATIRDADGATTIATQLAVAGPLPIPFVTLASGAYDGITSPVQAIVRDSATWESLWRQHTSNITPPIAAPVVDFSRQTVIAVVLGSRPTGGYSIRVVEVLPPGAPAAPLIVRVEESSPPPGVIVTQAFTSPFHFVTIPRWDGPVRFDVLEEPLR